MDTKKYLKTTEILTDMQSNTESRYYPLYRTEEHGALLTRVKTEFTTKRPIQNIAIEDIDLELTQPEVWFLYKLKKQLMINNALWKCEEELKTNGNTVKTIKQLIDKKILIKTHTTNYYIVNPFYFRRGEFYTTVQNTISIIRGRNILTEDLIKNIFINTTSNDNKAI